ncbi:MAG: PorT family protein [Bacteroidales bacterium]|nr:PorT family protein [Bacteroidales bacterium]
MKHIKFLILFICSFYTTSLFAQHHYHFKNLPDYDNKMWHFGFTVGFNNMNFGIDKSDDFFEINNIYGIEAKKYTCFHVGPVSNLRLNKYFDFRMLFDLSFNQRDIIYKIGNTDNLTEINSQVMKIQSTMLEFPFHFKYRAERMNNFAPYLIAGGNIKYDISAAKQADNGEETIRLNTLDPCVEWGGGFDFYLTYFKLSIELKYSKGLSNVLNYDNTQYSNAIKRLESNAFVISFHFEG